ncbi:MAG: PstS family phosphate ABC transporter substrate-binding protein [Gemmatimonadetes bacterium]|nr:PstS family phosphate ABC transporter substrate-binding protein [Gemmatimonadota bacterium]
MRRHTADLRAVSIGFVLALACGGTDTGESLTGTVDVDGSSTVYLITEAVAEEFSLAHGSGIRVNVSFSGTGGGFKRFCAGETDISDASRPITESERELCTQNGVSFLELKVALDGVAVTVNPRNDFVQCMRVDELKRIWEPGSTVSLWSEVRREWPSERIRLYGAGTNSGTFDYFTEAIMGESRASRPDYTASEDDNVLVQGVEGDRFALGYFGFAYYQENASRIKIVSIDSGTGCVEPTLETIESGTYSPLSRPLFIYVKTSSLARPAVQAFVEFYLQNAAELSRQVGYVPLDAAEYQSGLSALAGSSGDD